MVGKRRRVKQKLSLKERLSAFATEVRLKAADLPPGIEREDMLRRARQADTASHLDEWGEPFGFAITEMRDVKGQSEKLAKASGGLRVDPRSGQNALSAAALSSQRGNLSSKLMANRRPWTSEDEERS